MKHISFFFAMLIMSLQLSACSQDIGKNIENIQQQAETQYKSLVGAPLQNAQETFSKLQTNIQTKTAEVQDAAEKLQKAQEAAAAALEAVQKLTQ